MKMTDKKKPVKTMPRGVWEATHDTKRQKLQEDMENKVTDLQGNGYPDLENRDSR